MSTLTQAKPVAPRTSRTLLKQREVADRLRMNYDEFSRHKAGLIADHGFPPPAAGCGNRWDPEAIDAWLDRQIAATVTHGGDQPVEIHADILDARARAIANQPGPAE